MKLAFSPASPYVRKCMASAIARGIESQIELWTVPTVDPSLVPVNPLSKVPSLVTPEGQSLYDSPVICEYLDSVGAAPGLFPAPGPARWNALRQQALGDGIMDATQPRRRELTLPLDEGRQAYIAQQQLKVTRALDALVMVPLTEGQRAALLSFIYNVGRGAFARSTMLVHINAGRMDSAASEFTRWVKAGGQVLPGLARRRAAEAKLFRGSA